MSRAQCSECDITAAALILGYYHADTTLEITDLTTPDSYDDDGELAHWDSRAVKSFFDDAARFVPDLALLIGGLLDAPVRREAQP